MTILSDAPIGDDGAIPTPALILGLAGVIPFLAGGIGALVLDPEWSAFATQATLLYGAVILSFLGGIRWGLAMSPAMRSEQTLHFTIAVLPSLLAWCALLVPQSIGIWMTIAGLIGMLLTDLQLTRSGQAPRWFQKLRIMLTTGACIGLLMAAL